MISYDADRTVNVFGRKGFDGLRCAVPADRPVPGFILQGTWSFEAQYRRGQLPLPSLAKTAALRLTDLTGYYFFIDFAAGETDHG